MLYLSITVPNEWPGKGEEPFKKAMTRKVMKKFQTQENIEAWFTRFTAARRRKMIQLWHRQNGLCVFCNCKTWIGDGYGLPKRDMATLEHIMPQTLGGTDHLSNLAMSCNGCNNIRGVADFHQFGNLRNDKSLWDEKCHAIANSKRIQAALGKVETESRKEKRKPKREEFLFGLTLLWLYFPEYHEAMRETERHFRETKERRLAHAKRKMENAVIDIKGFHDHV